MTRLPRSLPARLRPDRIRRAAVRRLRAAAARFGPPRAAPELLAVLDGCTLTVRLPLTAPADLELRSGRRRIRLPLAAVADGAAPHAGPRATSSSGADPSFFGTRQAHGPAHHRTGAGPAARRGNPDAGADAVAPVPSRGETEGGHWRHGAASAGAALDCAESTGGRGLVSGSTSGTARPPEPRDPASSAAAAGPDAPRRAADGDGDGTSAGGPAGGSSSGSAAPFSSPAPENSTAPDGAGPTHRSRVGAVSAAPAGGRAAGTGPGEGAQGGIGASLALHGGAVEVPDGRWELAVVAADGRRVLEAPAAAAAAVPGCASCGREFAVEADTLGRAVLSVRPRGRSAELRGLLLRPHCATVLAALTGPGHGSALSSAVPAAFAVPAGGGAPVQAATRSDPDTGGFRIDLPVTAMAAAGGRWEIAVAPSGQPSPETAASGPQGSTGVPDDTAGPAAGPRIRLGPGALLPPGQPFRAPARTVLPPDGPPVRIRTSATNEGVLTVSASPLGLPQ